MLVEQASQATGVKKHFVHAQSCVARRNTIWIGHIDIDVKVLQHVAAVGTAPPSHRRISLQVLHPRSELLLSSKSTPSSSAGG